MTKVSAGSSPALSRMLPKVRVPDPDGIAELTQRARAAAPTLRSPGRGASGGSHGLPLRTGEEVRCCATLEPCEKSEVEADVRTVDAFHGDPTVCD